MKILKEIELNMDSTRTHFIIYDLATMAMVTGTTSVSQNPHLHNVKKTRHNGRIAWTIPKKEIKNRIEKMENTITNLQAKLKVMKSIMNGGK